MAAAKCRNRRRELTDTLQAVCGSCGSLLFSNLGAKLETGYRGAGSLSKPVSYTLLYPSGYRKQTNWKMRSLLCRPRLPTC